MKVSNERSCESCDKLQVCKYHKKVMEKVKEITGNLDTAEELPLSVNINCDEWNSCIKTKRTPW